MESEVVAEKKKDVQRLKIGGKSYLDVIGAKLVHDVSRQNNKMYEDEKLGP